MKRTKIGLAILGTTLALGVAAPTITAQAQQPRPQQEKPEKDKSFHGKVDAVDSAAKTLTVGGTLIYVSDNTKITKKGKAIMLSEIMAGDQVHGTTRQTFDGKTEAVSVTVGDRSEPEQK
jgi:hypothetical protein